MIIKRWEDHRNLVVGVAFAVTKRKLEKSLSARDSNTVQGSVPPYKPDLFFQVFISRLQKLRPQLPWSSLISTFNSSSRSSNIWLSYIDYSTCDYVR